MKLKTSITALSLLTFLGPAHMKESPNTIAEAIVIQDREFSRESNRNN